LSDPELLSAGRVGRPHGLDGSFHVTKPRTRLLSVEIPLRVAGEPTDVLRRAGTDDRPILKVALAQTREAVEALRGAEIQVLRSDAPALDKDEWWAEDFPGCAVVDGDTPVGEVVEMMALPANEVLRVRRPDGRELLVPLIADAVRDVDMAARRIDMNLAFLGEED
jgi:16S rRNA processing protein RimM